MTKSKKYLPTQPKPPPPENQGVSILAIDPGIDRIGIAILTKEGGRNKLLFSECFQTNRKDSQALRLSAVGEHLMEVIRSWRPEVLAIETLFFNQNTTSALKVSEARGVITFVATQLGLEIAEYSPQAVKIAITSYGKAGKREMETMIRKLVKIPESDKNRIDDELDAIALGITHLATRKPF